MAYEDLDRDMDFNMDVRPILSDKCFACHGPDKGKLEAGLRLDLEENAKGGLVDHPGARAIVEGSSAKSMVVSRILTHDEELVMPPEKSKLVLKPKEKAILVRWIEQGAQYDPHWSFLKPVKAEVPEGTNPIDYLIAEKLKEKGLEASPPADPETLLRRVTFDLTGLPPTLAQMDSFLNDKSLGAYERQVDKLMGSVHYGERMATTWMDAARYADTHGYTVDRYRDVSPWRDWVIKSFNENMPYDEFFTLQLAGDLLPGASKDELIPTAFLRLHPQNMEGGIVDEEFRVEYVSDRTNTFSTAFMGLTMACAKCHDHKFDPISQKEYFELFSFFNNLDEAGQISWDNAMPVPTMLLTDEKQDSIISFVASKVEDVEDQLSDMDQMARAAFESWIASGKYKEMGRQKMPHGVIGFYPLDNNLDNAIGDRNRGFMAIPSSSDEPSTFTEGYQGKGILLDGDAWLDLGGVGVFERYDEFTVALDVKIPPGLRDGVIFHKGSGAALYNFRGFHLALKDNRIQIVMAHTTPANAIIEYSDTEVPRDEWVQFALSYDGSSRASGLKVFMNGHELVTTVKTDNLYKSILFNSDNEPGVQIGARWRGKGIGESAVDNIAVFDRSLSALEILRLADPESWEKILTAPMSLEGEDLMMEYFVKNEFQRYKILSREARKYRNELSQAIDAVDELMVYQEMPSPRPTFILDRGLYDSYKEQVSPSAPEQILPFDSTLSTPNRLDLVKWLAHPDHPLTARVMVNRIWLQFFGKGLVESVEDFGNQGTLPTNGPLLDHLAVTFIESGWDIKAMIKLIVTSDTYRQSSLTSQLLLEKDPRNIWLARGPSRRLTAEMIRDQALTASGLLNRKVGGESVSPYQPEGLWSVNSSTYTQSTGEDLYRRSLYTIWKRSVPHPTQGTFDAPDRSECIVRRQETNTPLQDLVLMNDPIFIESAREIGRQMAIEDDVSLGFRRLTGRSPQMEELSILEEMVEVERKKFGEDPSRAMGWLGAENTQEVDASAAAYAVVASTIMNSDAFIMKR